MRANFQYDNSSIRKNEKNLNSSENKSDNFSTKEINSTNNFFQDEEKKITIKDLCPEDKGKIGELLKKLAIEKEEKENLEKNFFEERLKNEKFENLLKEK